MRILFNKRNIFFSLVLFLFLSVSPFFVSNTSIVFAADSVTEVDVVAFNDFHGQMMQLGKDPGAAKFAAILKKVVNENPDNSILVSVGDNYTGQAMSNITYGASVNECYKILGVSLSAVGNHEFDWGPSVPDFMAKWQHGGGFHYLAANLYSKKTKQPVAWAKPYEIVNKAGIKIGFIGLTTLDTIAKTNPLYIKDVEFRSPVESAKYWSEYLKSGKSPEGKADVVIVLAHMGGEQDANGVITGESAPLTSIETIDAIVTGHEHTFISGTLNGKPVVQGLKFGRAYTKLRIMIDSNGKVSEILPFAKKINKDSIDAIADDPAVKSVVDKYNHDPKYSSLLNDIIATSTVDLGYEREKGLFPLSEWICNLMRKSAGTEIAMLNGNVIKEGPKNGKLTVGNVYEMLLDDLVLETFKMKGSDLKKVFEYGIEAGLHDAESGWPQHVGIYIKYDKNLPYGSRIISMTLENGQLIDENTYYTVATSESMYAGVNGFDFKSATNAVNQKISVRKLMIDELQKTKTLSISKVEYYSIPQ